MALSKPDKFTRCFADFVKYLNVVEPYEMQFGRLSARVGFASDDCGKLHFWTQDWVCPSSDVDNTRYARFFERTDKLVYDLNNCRSFVDDKIKHTFDIYDKDDGLCFEVVRIGSGVDSDGR